MCILERTMLVMTVHTLLAIFTLGNYVQLDNVIVNYCLTDFFPVAV